MFDWIKLTFGIKKLNLKPNDILIVNLKEYISPEGVKVCQDQLKEILTAKGIKNEVLVLTDGATFSKIRIKRSKKEPPKPWLASGDHVVPPDPRKIN